LVPAAVLALALAALAFAMQTGRSALGPVGLLLGAWVVFGALTDLWARTGREARLARLTRLPRADWGKACAHAGLGVTIFAVAAMNAWKVEDIRVVQLGESFPLGSYTVLLKDVREVEGPNYLSTTGEMVVSRNGAEVAVLYPEKRIYPVAAMPTTEAAIDYGLVRDLYLVLGDKQKDGGWAVRSYIEPFANWLWGGALLMAFGGLLSLSDRRYRVAAGARRLPAGVPAE
jgi:cytochrome c-type biogenesis protein CcmF